MNKPNKSTISHIPHNMLDTRTGSSLHREYLLASSIELGSIEEMPGSKYLTSHRVKSDPKNKIQDTNNMGIPIGNKKTF